jgi:HEAT repeat protein
MSQGGNITSEQSLRDIRRRTPRTEAYPLRWVALIATFFLAILFAQSVQPRVLNQEASTPAVSRLRSKDTLARIEAIMDIRWSGAADPKTASALIDCILRDDNDYVRQVASEALSSMGPQAKSKIPAMLTVLRDHGAGWIRRARAAQVLGAIGNYMPGSMLGLAEVATDNKEPLLLRQTAAFSLVALGRITPELVPTISEVAFSPREDPTLRKIAIWVLAGCCKTPCLEL